MTEPAPPASAPVPTARIVRCPACGGRSAYVPSNPSRPFCSERCRSNDLGAWAAEEYRVAAPLRPSADDDLTD
jgi:endogenous inhibitor of DNA gyrase (YacG/DUF329 family)